MYVELFFLLAMQSSGLPAPPSPAKAENPLVWKPRTKSVSVFKNGLGFFLREGEVSLRDGWCFAQEIPPALFGTFAVFSLNPDEIVDIVGAGPGEIVEFDGRDAPETEEAKRERLERYRGLSVSLLYRKDGLERAAVGAVVSVGPEFAILESEGLAFAVPIEAIRRLELLDLPLRIHVQSESGRPVEKTRLAMAYLRKGVTWIPEYTLRILDEETAELSLRGTQVNEAEDLIRADVRFVVGVPHFLHTEYMAPIAVGQAIRTIGAAVVPREIQTQIMNRAAIAVDNSARGSGREVVHQPLTPEGGDLSKVLAGLPKIEIAGSTDFTVYEKKDLTLHRGEKAVVTLFSRKVSYGHVYRWSLPGRMEHFLQLKNATDTAWTTGPCLAVSGGQPLSEDILPYTARGSQAEFPISAAINVAHEKSEMEVDRELKAHLLRPDEKLYLDLVTVEGKLQIQNFEKSQVQVVISVSVPGKPTWVSEKGSFSLDAESLKLLERKGKATWSVQIEPGKTKELSYRYERYVPSN